MKKPSAKLVTVTDTFSVTPNMQRITLQGEALADFPLDCEGGYIKLLFNPVGGTDLSQQPEDSRPVMRTYTIRRFDPNKSQIEVDFVKHVTEDQQCGFAARWAMAAKQGDTIHISGPGIIQNMNLDADWYFMTADMTSLPALSAKIQRLPQDAQGYAVIKVQTEDDIQTLEAPVGMKIEWVTQESLEDAAKRKPWLNGQVSVWCACEFDSMRALRQYFRNEHTVDREYIYISSYWKQGVSEDGHKVLKREDAESQPN